MKDNFQEARHFVRKIVNLFLPINCNDQFGCSKEPSHFEIAYFAVKTLLAFAMFDVVNAVITLGC